MKFSFQRFFLIATTVVGTVSVAAEPCAPNGGNYGQYDMTACNECAEHGKKHGQCCGAIYRNSLGRSDDDGDDSPTDGCVDLGDSCDVGSGACTPGLTCTRPSSEEYILNANVNRLYTCEKQSYPAGASLLRDSSSSSTRHDGLEGCQESSRRCCPPPSPIQRGGSYVHPGLIERQGKQSVQANKHTKQINN